MLDKIIPNFNAELVSLRGIAPSGFIVAFNMTFRGPEYMHSEYPEAWRAEYEDRNYFAGDPVLVWTIANSGTRRWSEISLPDVRGILKRAQLFSMNYGAVISTKNARKRSFITVSRPDRELTDGELQMLSAKFKIWVELVTGRAALTDGELDVLRLMRDGEGQRNIAEALDIAESTVKQRAQKAVVKLGAKNRTHAVAIAVTRNYFD